MTLLKETVEKLQAQTSVWKRNKAILMTQSLLLMATGSTHRCDELVSYWQALKQNREIFSGLQEALLNTIGVLGMVYGIAPEKLMQRIALHRERMKEIELTGFFSSGSVYTKGTACYLALLMEDSVKVLPRVKLIMEGWKEDHPWVTGNNDLFYAVLHALQDGEPAKQIRLTEECFQALKRGGHAGWADELQAAAQVVALWPDVDPERLEKRYRQISQLISAHFSFFSPNIRPAVSLLAASNCPASDTVAKMMSYYEELRTLGLSSRDTRLMLAANLAMLEDFDEEGELNARLIFIVVGVIYIQEVAVMAAAAAAGGAT